DAVLLLERRKHLTVVRPVERTSDQVDVALLLGLGDHLLLRKAAAYRLGAGDAAQPRCECGPRSCHHRETGSRRGASLEHLRAAEVRLPELPPELDFLVLVVLHMPSFDGEI